MKAPTHPAVAGGLDEILSVEELRKLPPFERIRKLKELESALQERIDTAKKLEQSSERELVAENDQQRAIPLQELKAWEIMDMFSPEARLMWESKRFTSAPRQGSDLEETVEQKGRKTHDGHHQDDSSQEACSIDAVQEAIAAQTYLAQVELAQQPMSLLYKEAQELYHGLRRGESSEALQEIRDASYTLMGVLEMKARAMEGGHYHISSGAEEIIEMLDGAKQMLKYAGGDALGSRTV